MTERIGDALCGGFPELLRKIILRGAKPRPRRRLPSPSSGHETREDLEEAAHPGCCSGGCQQLPAVIPRSIKTYMPKKYTINTPGTPRHPGYAHVLKLRHEKQERSGYTWMEKWCWSFGVPDNPAGIRKVSGGPVRNQQVLKSKSEMQSFGRQQPGPANPTVPGEIETCQFRVTGWRWSRDCSETGENR